MLQRRIELSPTGWLTLFFFVFLVITAVGTRLFPYMTQPVRAFIVVTVLLGLSALATAVVGLCRRSRQGIAAIVVIVLALTVWCVAASRPVDSEALRRAYVKSLLSFDGTEYVWGGEMHYAVDCSGLARAALWQAMIKEGLRTGNPRLLGPALWRFWWTDMSANTMGTPTRFTRPICNVERLAGYHNSDVRTGDLAVTHGHVLIYIGNGKWIESNPDDHKVVVNAATADTERAYFRMDVTISRWWILQ
jgi:hypothetical protein